MNAQNSMHQTASLQYTPTEATLPQKQQARRGRHTTKPRLLLAESICAEAGLDYSGAPSMWAESATAHQYVMTTQPLPDTESDDESHGRPQGLRAALAEAEAEAPQSLNGSAQAVLEASPNNSQPSGKPDFGKQSYGGGMSARSAAPITVEYTTGWSQAYIHHSKSDGSAPLTSLCVSRCTPHIHQPCCWQQ